MDGSLLKWMIWGVPLFLETPISLQTLQARVPCAYRAPDWMGD